MIKPKPHDLKIIVASTGRCGSVYMAKFLSDIGIHCSHECIFSTAGFNITARSRNSPLAKKEGLIDMPTLQAESSLFAVPFLNHKLLKDVKVIHLMRHPLKVIKSFVVDLKMFGSDTEFNRSEKFLRSYYDLSGCQSAIERASMYYIACNQMIEASAITHEYFRFRIEDNVRLLFENLQIPFKANYYNDKKCNSYLKTRQPTKDITWDDIDNREIRQKLMQLAGSYGYTQ